MSRTAALWISAILTLAFALVVGATVLRSSGSHAATAPSQPVTTVLDAGAGTQEQPVASEYQDDHHNDTNHHEDADHHEEHDDDD
jgi:hypothetical protein